MLEYTRHSKGASERRVLTDVYDSGQMLSGKCVSAFEQAFAKRLNVAHACAVSSGTSALHLCVEAVKRKYPKQGKVITTPLTFVATVAALTHGGFATHSFADIDPHTLNFDLDIVDRALAAASPGDFVGIMVVHFAGYPVDMPRVADLAARYGLWVIEDAAHALGSAGLSANDSHAFYCGDAQYSDLCAFSFHPAKNITTGEGGMVTTRHADMAHFVNLARSHCMDRQYQSHPWEYDVPTLGFNYRMTEFQAAMGSVQLERLDEFIAQRQALANRYYCAFAPLQGIEMHPPTPQYFHSYNLFIIEVPKRDTLYIWLKDHGILCQILYKPLHLMSYFTQPIDHLPCVERYYARCLALPIFPELTTKEQDRIIYLCQTWHQHTLEC